MKKISLFLAIVMMFSCFALVSCGSEEGNDKGAEIKKEVTIKDMTEAVKGALDFEGKVSEFVYKENDKDGLAYYVYYLVDTESSDKITDYVFTNPTDYCQTFAVFRLDETATDADFEAIKTAVNDGYIAGRKSSLQMYMPEEYAKMKWASEHTDEIWKRYGNDLVLCVYDDAAPTAAWNAIDGLVK